MSKGFDRWINICSNRCKIAVRFHMSLVGLVTRGCAMSSFSTVDTAVLKAAILVLAGIGLKPEAKTFELLFVEVTLTARGPGGLADRNDSIFHLFRNLSGWSFDALKTCAEHGKMTCVKKNGR